LIIGRGAAMAVPCGGCVGPGGLGGSAGAAGTALGSKRGARTCVPPGPSIVTLWAAISCTVQPAIA